MQTTDHLYPKTKPKKPSTRTTKQTIHLRIEFPPTTERELDRGRKGNEHDCIIPSERTSESQTKSSEMLEFAAVVNTVICLVAVSQLGIIPEVFWSFACPFISSVNSSQKQKTPPHTNKRSGDWMIQIRVLFQVISYTHSYLLFYICSSVRTLLCRRQNLPKMCT